jgi:hypothetical protein
MSNQFYFAIIEYYIHPRLPLQREISVAKYSTDIFPTQEEPNQKCALQLLI